MPVQLHIGICGAGIGGVLAAIAIADAGAKVTILEAANELGEIGAGIQMTPNAARLLQRYGVDKVIGDNLVQFEELNMRRKDGTRVGYTSIPRIEKTLGYPWWVVHRHHLHNGLVEIAEKRGCTILTRSRVSKIDHQNGPKVNVVTESGNTYIFDLLIGADGVRGVVRQTLFPEVTPRPPTGNCAYRAIVPYAEIRKDPSLRELVSKMTMEVWMAPSAYIITYPISAGRDFNLVLSHDAGRKVSTVEDVDIEELRSQYKDFDPRIRKIVNMIPSVQRWPLLVTGPLDTWRSQRNNVVLMGDAAHSMTNHMAQGAATSMEDGAFLARCLYHVINSSLPMSTALEIYEHGRRPLATRKQQISFLNGAIWQLEDGPAQRARDEAMSLELEGGPILRSPNLYGDPWTVLEVYGYDVEAHAENEIQKWIESKKISIDDKEVEQRIMGWFAHENRGSKL